MFCSGPSQYRPARPAVPFVRPGRGRLVFAVCGHCHGFGDGRTLADCAACSGFGRVIAGKVEA